MNSLKSQLNSVKPKNKQHNYLFLGSVAKCRGSWVVGRGRGSCVWVWINVVGKKKYRKNMIK